MRFSILFSTACLCSTSLAQPTLTSADGPIAGQVFSFVEASYATLPNTGVNQTWDASSASTTGGGDQQWVTVGSTTAGSSFPNATIALVTPLQEQFIQQTATQRLLIGTFSNGIVTTCSNPSKTMQFPCTYGMNWTDTYQCSYTYQGNTYTNNGTLTANADGYGTLILPYGSIANVLRFSVSEVVSAVVQGVTYVTTSNAQYYWRPGTATYVAVNVQIAQTINGSPAGSDEEINYLAEGSIGMDEALTRMIGVELAPNPAAHSVTVTFGASGARRMSLLDVQGRIVRSQELGDQGPGIFQKEMVLAGVAPGVYSVLITDENGQFGMQRLVVE
jgi:hypothetical protein